MRYDEMDVDWENHVLIFVHIPKTGGTSLFSLLERNWGSDAILRTRFEKPERVFATSLHMLQDKFRLAVLKLRSHMEGRHPLMHGPLTAEEKRKIRLISGHFPSGSEPDIGKQPLYISLVRNPVDRFISDYFFTRDQESTWTLRGMRDPKRRASRLLDIDAYARLLLKPRYRPLRNVQCQYIGRSPNFEDARRFIDEKFFLCAPTEEIGNFTETLAGRLGLPETEVPHARKGKSRPRKISLSPETLDIVHELYDQDIQLYQYVRDRSARNGGEDRAEINIAG